MLIFIVFVLIIVCFFVKSLWDIRSTKWPPQYPGVLPIIGHAHLLMGNTLHIWKLFQRASELSLKNGGALTVSWPTKHAYFITDPEDWAKITNTFMKKGFFYDFAHEYLGDGLITAKDTIWRPHRRMLNPSFKQQVLNGFIDTFNSQSRRLVKMFEDKLGKEAFDPINIFGYNSIETIYLTEMGIDAEDEANCYRIMNAVDDVERGFMDKILNVWLNIPFIYNMTKAKQEHRRAIDILHGLGQKVIDTKKLQLKKQTLSENQDYVTESDTNDQAFLDILLDESNGFSDKHILDEVNTMILASFESSAIALTFIMMLLASNQEVQNKACNEIQKVFGDSDRNVEKQDLPHLVYIEAIIKESLRLYPVAPLVARRIDKEIKLKKWSLAAGSTCILSIYGSHRHPMWGPDVEEFNPDRWLDQKSLPEFLSFSSGRRMCIGKSYAMMTLKTILVHFLRHYQVFREIKPLELELNMVLKPISGHEITIKRRQNNVTMSGGS